MPNTQTVFSGNQLYDRCTYRVPEPKYMLMGQSENGNQDMIPITDDLLSHHILLLGGIGSGKTNTFNLLLRNIRPIPDNCPGIQPSEISALWGRNSLA